MEVPVVGPAHPRPTALLPSRPLLQAGAVRTSLRTFGRLLAILLVVVTASSFASSGAIADPIAGVAAGDDPSGQVTLMLFWGDGCPHCEAERAWLDEAARAYPHLQAVEHEVWYDANNRALLEDTADRLGFEVTGVPTTVIGERHWVGFSDAIRAELEETIGAAATSPGPGTADTDGPGKASSTVNVPLAGEVQVSADSLVLSTVVIGFVDGVNPCSLWVITVLLAIVVRTRSRRRVLALGTAFLLVTAAMYAVYMAGIYSAMSVVDHLGAVQALVAVVAGVFGIVSVKDYFAFKKGLSFTIPASAKPGIYRRMRAAAGRQALLPALAATTVLAVGVSLLETPCTAGFPVLWTGLLAAGDVGAAEALLLFGLYMLPFLVDELLVFGAAVVTLRATKMQERHGRLLKLVAGAMMLSLAGTVLARPETMSEPLGALAVFAAAFALAGAVHLVSTRLRDGSVPRHTEKPQARAAP